MSKNISSSVFRSFVCGVACAFAQSVMSQEVIELPVPVGNTGVEEVAAEFAVEPQAAGLSIEGDDFEILTRGPLHEAFAEPIVADPVPGFVVAAEPPAPINELMPEFRPDGEDAIWIAGYWGRDEQREDFIWISGVYRVPPVGHQWVPGYWHQVTDGWQWVQGFWVADVVESIAYLPAPPPTLENGPSSPSPGVDYFYIPGNWTQAASGFLWNTGYWHPMQDDLVWVPSHTVWTPRGCVYVAGYWDHRLPLRGLCFAPVSVSRVTYSRPGWYLRPTVVLNSQIVLQNLFVQPGYNHYLFGDYYGLPANHRHVLPAHVYHQKRGACDPLISFYSAYNARQGQDMIRWCGNHYADLNRNPEKRPAHHWSPSVENDIHNTKPLINEPFQLAHSLDQVNKISSGLRVSPISESTKQNNLQRGLEHKQLARDRELSERNNAAQGIPTLSLPKSEITQRKSDLTTKIGKLPDAPRYAPPNTPRNLPSANKNLNASGSRLPGNLDVRGNDSKRLNPSLRLENSLPLPPRNAPPAVTRRIESKPSKLSGDRGINRDTKPPLTTEQLGRVLIPNQPRNFDPSRRLEVPNRNEPNRAQPNRVAPNRIKEQTRRFEPPKIQNPNAQPPLGIRPAPTELRNRMNLQGETRNKPFTPPVGSAPSPKPPVVPRPGLQGNIPEARSNPSSQPERQPRLGMNDRGNSAQNDPGKKPGR